MFRIPSIIYMYIIWMYFYYNIEEERVTIIWEKEQISALQEDHFQLKCKEKEIDMFQWTDSLLLLGAVYVTYRIGWGDGLTAVNACLSAALTVAFLYIILQRTGYWKRLDDKRKAAEMEKEQTKR